MYVPLFTSLFLREVNFCDSYCDFIRNTIVTCTEVLFAPHLQFGRCVFDRSSSLLSTIVEDDVDVRDWLIQSIFLKMTSEDFSIYFQHL